MCHTYTHIQVEPDQSKHSLLSVGGYVFCPTEKSVPEHSPGLGQGCEGSRRRTEAVFHLCPCSERRQPQPDQRPGILIQWDCPTGISNLDLDNPFMANTCTSFQIVGSISLATFPVSVVSDQSPGTKGRQPEQQCYRNRKYRSGSGSYGLLVGRLPRSSVEFGPNIPQIPTVVHQPEKDEPWIPPFIENFNEPVDEKRRRLMYQSRKRGMLENGLLLGRQVDLTT